MFEYDIVVGIDLSFGVTGWSVYSKIDDSILDVGYINTKNSKTPLLTIRDSIKSVLNKYSKHKILVAKEKQAMQYGAATQISTISALSKAHAIAELICEEADIPIIDVSSVTAKIKVCGSRSVEKTDVYNNILKLYPNISFEGIPGYATCDVTDSIAVAITVETTIKKMAKEEIKENRKEISKLKEKLSLKKNKKNSEKLNLLEERNKKLMEVI